jgi:SOS-response transcriptional repressor LexA
MDRGQIRALKEARGFTNKAIAEALGITPDKVSKSLDEKGTRQFKAGEILKLRELLMGEQPSGLIVSEVAPTGINDPMHTKFGDGSLTPVPVVGSAEGSEYQGVNSQIEMTELDMGEILDHVRRPQSLKGDAGAYAVTIVGDSMYPRFRPGRRVIVSPRAPVVVGDDVIVQLVGEENDFGERRVVRVLIKELVRRSGSFVELRQFNPDITFKVERSDIAAIHKVAGELF